MSFSPWQARAAGFIAAFICLCLGLWIGLRPDADVSYTVAAVVLGLVPLALIGLLIQQQRASAREAAVQREEANRRTGELASAAAQLSALWQQSPLSVILFDPHDPDVPVRITDCNPVACEMHGFAREELIGQSIDIIEARPWAVQWRHKWMEQIRAARTTHGESFHRRKDGSVFPIEYSTSLVVVNGREYVIGMDRDATARRSAEQALRDSEQRWQLALAGSNEGVWDWDIQADEFWVSQRWKSMLGLPDDGAPRNREEWLDRMHPDDRAQFDAELAAHLMQRTELFEYEYRMRHHDGSWCWILSRGKAHFGEDDHPSACSALTLTSPGRNKPRRLYSAPRKTLRQPTA